MGILTWGMVGFLVGTAARRMPGRGPAGVGMITLVAMIGMLIEGFQWALRGSQAAGEPIGFGIAVVGTMSLAIARAIRDRPRPSPR